jgi:anti-sigma B factor antagonist
MVHVDTITRRDTLRLAVQGQLDMNAEGVFNGALTRAGRPGQRVEVDLGEVDFIDGSGLSMLIDAQSHAHRAGYEFVIVGASRPVHRLIEIAGATDHLPPIGAPESREPVASTVTRVG